MTKKAAEERNVKVKARVNLKYDSDVVKVGEEFDIRQSDLKELQDKEYVSYTPPAQMQQTGQDNGQQVPPADK